ncbi:MAG: response regulator [Candidatus Saccharimonas sp.]
MTKILLVEDDKSLREIYGVRLLAEGYDIVSAGDGEEALAMAIKDRPGLIISDVMMPKISGFDMLDILRSTTETKDIKVIMMTALSSEDQRQRGVALGADRYLVKSQVGIEDVVRTVHEVLGDAPISSASHTSTPAPIPTPQPIAAQPVAPAPTQAQAPAPNSAASTAPNTEPTLPQPTAPFSTPRPASLGDRVIHPLSHEGPTRDFGSMMAQELSTTPTPTTPVAPQTPATPASPLEPRPNLGFAAPQPAPIAPPTPPVSVTSPTPPTPVSELSTAPTQPSASTLQPVASTSTFTVPTPSLAAPTVPTAPATPQQQPSNGLSFEETPRPGTPPMPPQA